MNKPLSIKKNFIDAVRILLRGGRGGSGQPKYGGIGGPGGNVYIEAEINDKKLFDLRSLRELDHVTAGKGADSRQFYLLGARGKDIIIPTPPSTVCTTDAGIFLGEVLEKGDRVLVAKGGDGGSPTNNYIGQKGQQHHVNFTLKTASDIGLVGFPNAGKSTLLKAIARSRFKPRIAPHPFTTLSPMLGSLEYSDRRTISIVDLPGLIEEAHANRGLGHAFLRHVERTKLLLLMVDVHGFQLNHKSPRRNVLETLLLLNKELELYDPLLMYKPAMLLVNKMDTEGASKIYEKLVHDMSNIKDILPTLPEEMRPKELLQLKEVVAISAKKNEKSVEYVKDQVRELLDIHTDSICENTLSKYPANTQPDDDIEIFASKLEERNVKLI
ncbi:GTP1/OBG domain [Trinorchestia longiramus]|nr:GTP1/OBG domain [Trinorchestia longiramus]